MSIPHPYSSREHDFSRSISRTSPLNRATAAPFRSLPQPVWYRRFAQHRVESPLEDARFFGRAEAQALFGSWRLFGDAALGSTKLKPYLLANVWRTFSGSDTTTFNTTPITTDFGNTSLELGGGVVAQLSRSVGVAAAASYVTNLGGDHRQGVKGNIELRVTW